MEPVEFDHVVGYKVPLSLGVADDVANLELTGRRGYVELWARHALVSATPRPFVP
ncbi:hypothetical protein [Streptomyces pacificus]|uniref:Uncharacterized protein n=1 Tax=Streptomyces pacificus TaxID=2705029 RepID=A0A6A0AW53_9ACTN|nr:hypothetical protein [Streptomyces pacificus]GFH35817.1 hypothetical protein SCWH03_20390 [Streptomyces pacificus]